MTSMPKADDSKKIKKIRQPRPRPSPRQPKSPKNQEPQTRPKQKSNNFKLRNLKYYIGETLRGFTRNKIMTLTSIATVAACLFIVVFSYAIASNVNFVLSYIENSVGVIVIVEEDFTEGQTEILRDSILLIENVESAVFISPEEALLHMAETLGDPHGLISSMLYDNPLRRTFSLELRDIRLQRDTVEAIRDMEGVADINEASDVTDMIVTVNNFVSLFSVIIILILGVLSVVIITNTIKLTVNSRRNEILIMRYVGATEWFIKWPFVIEGVLIGVLGAVVPLIISWISYDNIIGTVREAVYPMVLPFRSTTDIFPIFAPIVIILGACIGILGSISSMRKYLSV